MPWVQQAQSPGGLKGRENLVFGLAERRAQSSRGHTGRFGCFAFPSQGIGLRPQPWAMFCRPIGPVLLGTLGEVI